MAEYMDRETVKKLIEDAIVNNWELEYTLEILEQYKSSDVVEREKLHEANERISELEESVDYLNGYVTQLVEKNRDLLFYIGKSIGEIIKYRDDEINDFCEVEVGAINGVLEILKRNVGE